MNVEKEIHEIKQRNARVEMDKKWETSWLRRGLILALTFVVVLAYNFTIQSNVNIYFASLVPVIGFFLSTLSLDFVRRIFEKRVK